MSDRVKTILLVTGFLVVVIGIGAGLYFAFFRQVVGPAISEPVAQEPAEEEPGVVLPGAGEGAPTPVAPDEPGEAALSEADTVARGGETRTTALTAGEVANLSASGSDLNYYDPNDGKFYTTDADGNIVSLSDASFPEVESVVWDENAEKAVLEFPDGSNVIYNFATETQVTLPRHWEDFSFAPGGDEIVAKSVAIDPNNRWIVTSSADGSNVRAVAPLGLNSDKVQISWSPNNKVIAFSDTAAPLSGGFGRKMIVPIGMNNENFKGLVVEGFDFTPEWSPDGRRLLYSTSGDVSQSRPMLWVTDATPATMGENRRSIGLNTWADKCAFQSATIAICAVPQNLPPNAGLQRELYRTSPDSVYQVDISSGRSSLIAIPETPTSLENLTVSSDGSALYFTNVNTGQAETMRLR